jgi:hypothetical protein
MNIIYVDKISSISESYFSFIYKKNIITEPPFACKQKPRKNGSDSYHFDKEDLIKIHKHFPQVYEFNSKIGISKNDYIAVMKNVFEQIIKNGDFIQLLSNLYGTSIDNTEIRWDSKNYSNDNPAWLNIDIPSKVCTVHSILQCTYIERKKETPLKGIDSLRRDGGWLRFDNLEEANRFCRDQYSGYKLFVHC